MPIPLTPAPIHVADEVPDDLRQRLALPWEAPQEWVDDLRRTCRGRR